MEDLKEHLLEIYREFAQDERPGIRRAAALVVTCSELAGPNQGNSSQSHRLNLFLPGLWR